MDEQTLLEELIIYCRIDEDVGEARILKLSAEEYLINAGIKKNYESNLYFLVIKMLVKHWYDNKGVIGNKDIEIPFGAICIINQLQILNLGDINAT